MVSVRVCSRASSRTIDRSRLRLTRSVLSCTTGCLRLGSGARVSLAFIRGPRVEGLGTRCHNISQTASILDFTLRSSDSSSPVLLSPRLTTRVPRGLNSLFVSVSGITRRTEFLKRSTSHRLNFLVIRNFLRLGNCSRRRGSSRRGVFGLRRRVLGNCKLPEWTSN